MLKHAPSLFIQLRNSKPRTMKLLMRLLGLAILATGFLVASSVGGMVHSILRELSPTQRYLGLGVLVLLGGLGLVLGLRRRGIPRKSR